MLPEEGPTTKKRGSETKAWFGLPREGLGNRLSLARRGQGAGAS
jgi:hypothetical protein